jgi:hypothetical protein
LCFICCQPDYVVPFCVGLLHEINNFKYMEVNCKLTFDWEFGNNNGYPRAEISNEVKSYFEQSINEKYSKFCKRINDEGGRILMGYSMDGKSVTGHLVWCSAGLSQELDESIG